MVIPDVLLVDTQHGKQHVEKVAFNQDIWPEKAEEKKRQKREEKNKSQLVSQSVMNPNWLR